MAAEPARTSNERHLIARVLLGDRAAGRALYDAHAPRVHRLVYRLVGDEELARDCTQDTFIRAFERLRDFRGDSALGTWLHRIAVSVALNAVRKRKRLARWVEPVGDAHEHLCGASPEDHELRMRLAEAIHALPEIYRVPFVMHDVEDYTHAEIAATLGIPEGTCKTRLATARAKLRAALADLVTE